MSTQKERFFEFITSSGYSIREAERLLGVSNGTLGHLNDNLSANLKDKISTNFQQLNMNWLLYGTGKMIVQDSSEVAYTRERVNNKVTRTLPLIPIDVIAGYNGIDEQGVRLDQCPQYQVPEFCDARAEYLIRVSGSSMYPKYSSGDILACRRVREITFIQWGKVYVIDSQQGAMVKRLFEIEGDPDFILCKSDNENYPPFRLPKDEIRSLSVVVGVIRME